MPSQKLSLNLKQKPVSGLSLKSIQTKKEHKIKQAEVVVDVENLPKDPFTEKALIAAWETFAQLLQKKGQHNLASILSIDTPKVRNTTIYLEYPNETNKKELLSQQHELLNYIRKMLNNYAIDLSVSVNDTMEQHYVYGTSDKYNKLKEKNPHIETLKTVFKLEI